MFEAFDLTKKTISKKQYLNVMDVILFMGRAMPFKSYIGLCEGAIAIVLVVIIGSICLNEWIL